MGSPWVSMLKWSSKTQMIWGYTGYPYDLGKPHQLVELVIQTSTSLLRWSMLQGSELVLALAIHWFLVPECQQHGTITGGNATRKHQAAHCAQQLKAQRWLPPQDLREVDLCRLRDAPSKSSEKMDVAIGLVGRIYQWI
jgi:hypothetical protein